MIFIKERDRDSWLGRNSRAFFGVEKTILYYEKFSH